MKSAGGAVAPIAALAVVIADQASKAAIRRGLIFGEPLVVCPGFFNLCHTRNTGAVWGILQQQNGWLVVFSVLVLALLAVFHRRLICEGWSQRVGMGCIVGGIIGNLIERVRLGWVTDFLDFYWQGAHWPCFNVADSAICVGALIYVVSSMLSPSRSAECREAGR